MVRAAPLTGLGIWIWELAKCEGGDLDKIAQRCLSAGVFWVAIKAGGSSSNGQVTRARVEQLRAAGIEVAAWWYSVPGREEAIGQYALLRDLVNVHGVHHLVMDAEIEWEQHGDRRLEALGFAQGLRRIIGPETYLADAPWPIVNAHPTFPWTEFGSIVDARMDQLYWPLSQTPFLAFAERADRQWANRHDVRCPIGCMVDYSGTRHAPIADLTAFLDRYRDAPARSLWSWQHISADEWAVLEERRPEMAETAPPTTKPEGPAA